MWLCSIESQMRIDGISGPLTPLPTRWQTQTPDRRRRSSIGIRKSAPRLPIPQWPYNNLELASLPPPPIPQFHTPCPGPKVEAAGIAKAAWEKKASKQAFNNKSSDAAKPPPPQNAGGKTAWNGRTLTGGGGNRTARQTGKASKQ